MPQFSTLHPDATCVPPSDSETDHDLIRDAVAHAAHLLPGQGPITAFVHHNTLHAFEDMEFDAAVRRGARLFGCHPYLPEATYREMLVTGRIRNEDIEGVLHLQLGDRSDDLLGFLGTRFHLHRAILKFPLHDGPGEDLQWVINESRAMEKFRDDAPPDVREQFIAHTRQWVMRELRDVTPNRIAGSAEPDREIPRELQSQIESLLIQFGKSTIERWNASRWESFTLQMLWKICEFGTSQAESRPRPQAIRDRPRDWLLDLTGDDPDEWVNETMIRFCAAFIDQGFSDFPLPNRDQGFLKCFATLYGQASLSTEPWKKGLAAKLRGIIKRKLGPVDLIQQTLQEFGVAPSRTESFIGSTLLTLPGFAGMMWQLETRGDRVSRALPPGTLLEYVAIRLVLDLMAARHAARSVPRFSGALSEPRGLAGLGTERTKKQIKERLRTTFRLFEVAQLLGWKPGVLARLRPVEWEMSVRELDQFSEVDRRQIYHLAFERKFQLESLDAIAIHADRVRQLEGGNSKPLESANPGLEDANERRPSFQICCCIDEREESFRRHLEEVAPECETWSVAGFFAIPMYYRGAADAHFTPLCPVTIQPKHYVREEVVYSLKHKESARRRARRTIGTVTHQVHIGSRTLTGGWFGTALLGSLATFPLVARTLFPRLTARFRGLLGSFVQPPEVTRLTLERQSEAPGPEGDGLGFTVTEMANSVFAVLRDIGLRKNFSRLVLIAGHGSSSLNNPHESAHDCGACAGARGGPNARAVSQMANDPRVRKLAQEKGLSIPADTIFVGAYHNTCDDSMSYFDLDQIPASHQMEFEAAVAAIDQARRLSAHERCRRFESAPLGLSADEALKHVEGRAADLSQVRPEYGHATNALVIVGRRKWSRGLFLDRRAFLQSYDPRLDKDDGTILAGILSAVIPVCAGISLEYYFSYVDPSGYGCGTKLPHNITALVGVMNGAASDLRTGLPWQMVEIHEPVRELFVIETTENIMQRIIDSNETIGRLCKGNWVKIAVFDGETSRISIYQQGRFVPYVVGSHELPVASSSLDWYRGWRDHLKFASIGLQFAKLPTAGARADTSRTTRHWPTAETGFPSRDQ